MNPCYCNRFATNGRGVAGWRKRGLAALQDGTETLHRDVGAWLAIIVWNNRGYGEIRSSMQAVGIHPEGVAVQPPDFALLAAAYGYRHRLIETAEALGDALRDFGRRRQVVMLEIAAD